MLNINISFFSSSIFFNSFFLRNTLAIGPIKDGINDNAIAPKAPPF